MEKPQRRCRLEEALYVMRKGFKKYCRISGRVWTLIFLVTVFGGCATAPVRELVGSDGTHEVLKELMGQNNKIVHLPSGTTENKPALLLLHGATDDPTEMMDIIREYKNTYDVFLYSYNFHMRVEKVGAALVDEMRRLKCQNKIGTNLTVVTYSYAVIVFRTALIQAKDNSVFEGASLIQLVPTAGGSFLARGMGLVAGLVGWVSKPTGALYPFGDFAEQLWEGEGNQKFFEVINPEQMSSILLEGDTHSLSKIRDKNARKRYQNGIGRNVTVIPEVTGVTHDYFPTHPVALAYLRKFLQPTNNLASADEVKAGDEHTRRDRALSPLP